MTLAAPTSTKATASTLSATLLSLTETEVETAMCLWEAFLEFHNNEDKPTALTFVRQKVGTSQMRHFIMRLIKPCEALWEALSADDKGVESYCSPFYWRFVPIFLSLCTVDPDSMDTFNPTITPPELAHLLAQLRNLPF